MGRFSTTVHIKNNVDRMRFVNTFCDVLKKRGFAPCTEDEAAVSYLLAFGEGWVTLANEDYKDNPQKSSDDLREMSKALKTSAFSVEVVDSDFAIMTLCTSNGSEDKVVVGDGSGYGVDEAEGDRKMWEPLLADGKTWEQFSEAAAAQEVFVEDVLGKVAVVLGIDPYCIAAEHDEISAKVDGNNDITAFYFKKAAAKEKSMSLNAAFKKVFGEALEPLGFKLIKSKFPYFVRVIGDEIVHVITYVDRATGIKTQKAFEILGGIATVYRKTLSFNTSPRDNTEWLQTLLRFGGEIDMTDSSYSASNFTYNAGNIIIMQNKIERALELTKQAIMPVLEEVNDLEACIKYYYRFQSTLMNLYDDELENDSPYHRFAEGLLLIKTQNRDNGEERMQRNLDNLKKWIEEGKTGLTLSDLEKKRELYNKGRLQQNAIRDKLLDDPELNKRAFVEIERRKAANTETLRSYGIEI